MAFNRFSLLLGIRLVLLMASFAAVGALVLAPGYHAATLLAVLTALVLTWEIVRFVSRTNQEVTRFLDAARYADFGQRFEFRGMGAGFVELGATFTSILDRFREERQHQEEELRHLKALFEHVPVPLISLHGDGLVTLWNNSARRLFGTSHVSRVEDLQQFGDSFYACIRTLQPGTRSLIEFRMDNVDQRMTLSASEIRTGGATETIVSLQNIQSELDGAQLSAWQDLVRVLTHEIMNSITPVASLARTAVDLMDDAVQKVSSQADVVEELNDARDAVSTVARRSDGLMNFVTSYRQLTRLPPPTRDRFVLSDCFADVARVASGDWESKAIHLATTIDPPTLDLEADREMVEQVLINLLQNAALAITDDSNDGDTGKVSLGARLNRRGRVTIEVADNGPGIPAEIESRIFVPFYTTRRDGSGVGLALSRQVMVAHGGSISHEANETGGATFTLVF